MTRRRSSSPVPLTTAVGVQESFGWLIDPAGASPQRLCELVRINRREAVLTCLEDGSTLVAPADGARQWRKATAAVACELVGIPEPPRHNQWRLDPFWVQRHRSAVWRALVEIVVERSLPVHYAAVMFARGRWDPAFWDGPCADSAAIFASSVQESMARGAHLRSAVLSRLDADHELDVHREPLDRARLLIETGWHDALEALPARIDAHRTLLAPGGRRDAMPELTDRPCSGTYAIAPPSTVPPAVLQLPGVAV
jgi:hypothetical protein